MKSYVADRQIRLVGKAWEIKRQIAAHAAARRELEHYISGLCSWLAQSAAAQIAWK